MTGKPASETAMPRTLLVKNADVLVTMDDARRELRGGGVFVEGNRIVAVGSSAELPGTADEVIDAGGHVVTPGLVNTHHHMYQSLTRAVPAAQDAELFGWLSALYPIWAGLTPEMVRVSTQVAVAELGLSGCTASSDHLYARVNALILRNTSAANIFDGCALSLPVAATDGAPAGFMIAARRGEDRALLDIGAGIEPLISLRA